VRCLLSSEIEHCKNSIIGTLVMLFLPNILYAQDVIPQNSGFSGYFLIIPGVFVVGNSLIVTGAPLLKDVGDTQISSIYDKPNSNSSPAVPTAGELNYTFSKSRTQLFFGNRFEDIIRLDVAFGLGVRQDVAHIGLIEAKAIFTPLELKYWSDPYIEGEDRVPTALNFPGFKIRWAKVFNTGLELSFTLREYQHEQERSGTWLVGEGLLDPNQVPSLNRDGELLRTKALYKIKINQHQLIPAYRFTLHNHLGDAVANTQQSFMIDYLYLTKKVILDTKLIVGWRRAQEIHPVYDQILDASRYGVAIVALFPIELLGGKGWNIMISSEYVVEDANIDFFDSNLAAFNFGLMWRHTRTN